MNATRPGSRAMTANSSVKGGVSVATTGVCQPSEIDYVLLCTQSPDYFLPTTACLLQKRLALSTRCGALDFNLGCSGFVYGLSLAKGLVETGQARNVLLLTAETYSKFIHPGDKSVRTIFGDAASATLVSAVEVPDEIIGSFVFGTDGSGGKNLIVPVGGMRQRLAGDAQVVEDGSGNRRTAGDLYMNGPEIFNFTLRVVPQTVSDVLRQAGRSLAEIDLFVFHQANQYMLEHLRKKLGVPQDKFWMGMADYGNTVSATIPIALKDAQRAGALLWSIAAGPLVNVMTCPTIEVVSPLATAEEAIRAVAEEAAREKKAIASLPNAQTAADAEALRRKLGTKVAITGAGKSGSIKISYFSEEEYRELMKKLGARV